MSSTSVEGTQLRIMTGGGRMSLFGLPFLFAGLFMLALVTGIVPMSGTPPPWTAWMVLAVMAAAFTSVGAVLVFGRTWVTIDIGSRQVRLEKGLLVPMTARAWALGRIDAVTLAFERGDSDTADAFPVRLTGPGDLVIDVMSPSTWGEGRACALAVARHTSLPLREASSDHPALLTAADADLSLVSRLRRSGVAAVHEQPAPPGSRCRVTATGRRVEIVIPLSETPVALSALGLIPAGVALAILRPLSTFFTQTHTPHVVGWIGLLFVGVFFGLVPMALVVLAHVRSKVGGHTVVVEGGHMRIEQRGIRRVHTTFEASLDDVLDIDFSSATSATEREARESETRLRGRSVPRQPGPRALRIVQWLARHARGRGVTVKSRHQVTDIAGHLSDEEVRYIADVLRSAIVASGT